MSVVRLIVLLALLLMVGCAPFEPGCPSVGCLDGLSVELVDPEPGPFRLEVHLPDGAMRIEECAESQSPSCYTRFFFEGVVAEEVTLRLTTATRTIVEVHRPDYSRKPSEAASAGASPMSAGVYHDQCEQVGSASCTAHKNVRIAAVPHLPALHTPASSLHTHHRP